MHVRKLLFATLIVAFGMAAAPTRASADWYLTPFVGANFGGDADFVDVDDFGDEFEQRVNFGAALGWMGGGIIGWEVDFGYAPNFFENTAGDFDFGDSNVTTLMGNVVVGIPVGGQLGAGIRPYGSGGIGLIRTHVDAGDFFDELSANDLGFNVGAGLHGYFTDHIGIRGDVRYFRSLEDDEPDDDFDLALADFDFWRATVGVTFRFGN